MRGIIIDHCYFIDIPVRNLDVSIPVYGERDIACLNIRTALGNCCLFKRVCAGLKVHGLVHARFRYPLNRSNICISAFLPSGDFQACARNLVTVNIGLADDHRHCGYFFVDDVIFISVKHR